MATLKNERISYQIAYANKWGEMCHLKVMISSPLKEFITLHTRRNP